jgi:hypothetical protein
MKNFKKALQQDVKGLNLQMALHIKINWKQIKALLLP